MEVGTKLFPAIFVEATSKEVLQFELGRTPTTLPLSAAVLQNSEKHVVPQVRFNFSFLHTYKKSYNQSQFLVSTASKSSNPETSSMVSSAQSIPQSIL